MKGDANVYMHAAAIDATNSLIAKSSLKTLSILFLSPSAMRLPIAAPVLLMTPEMRPSSFCVRIVL